MDAQNGGKFWVMLCLSFIKQLKKVLELLPAFDIGQDIDGEISKIREINSYTFKNSMENESSFLHKEIMEEVQNFPKLISCNNKDSCFLASKSTFLPM